MRLTQKQRDQLWGEDHPYFQVQAIPETRILGDKVSRVFMVVEVSVNPFTVNLIRKNPRVFADNQEIQQFIEHAEFRGQHDGYVSCAFIEEMRDDAVIRAAEKRVHECERMVLHVCMILYCHILNVHKMRKDQRTTVNDRNPLLYSLNNSHRITFL